jgi:hypothetical protein
MKASIYLDVDGVFNAVSAEAPRQQTGWQGDWVGPVKVGGMPILYSQELVAAVNELAARPDVTVKWLTSWEEIAARDLAPAIGLAAGSHWEVISGVEFDDPSNFNWWKLDRIRQDLAATRPGRAVWVDDDIAYDPKTLVWLMSPGLPMLHLSPRTVHGLTRGHIRQINDFLDGIPEDL